MGAELSRFTFIGHALRGDGPFRPAISTDVDGRPTSVGTTYLVKYPRESDAKFARRNELAFYASPLGQAASRFTGYLSTREPVRDLPHQLYKAVADDADGKGNALDQFWLQFMVEAKARGSMLLLIDMPAINAGNQAQQLALRAAPIWTPIAPEVLTDYQIGDDGRFVFAEFSGTYTAPDSSEAVACTWRFDRAAWRATDKAKRVLAEGEHPLGACPLLIFTEGGDFPHFGPFAAIADMSKRLFNLDSELDEILRSQTFSLLTMQVPDDSSSQQKLDAAAVAGQTIGTNNLLVHSGSTPAFIAPPDGPAKVYLDRIAGLQARIDDIALNVATPSARESGIALQLRFQAINAELSRFASRMEDLEANAWELSRRWLGMTAAPTVQWPRDFNLLDVLQELQVLAEMRATAMPEPVIAQQMRRITSQQFVGADQATQDDINAAIDRLQQAAA
jgi:hypothetical protein